MLFSRFCILLCALVTVNTAYTIYFFLIHDCTNSLSSLHILVHHCTFCTSLHTKTSPGVLVTSHLESPSRPNNILLYLFDRCAQEAQIPRSSTIAATPGARTTIVASLLYASPAWWGFPSTEERARLERLIARLRRGGYLPQDFPTFRNLGQYRRRPTTSCSSPSSRIHATCHQSRFKLTKSPFINPATSQKNPASI